MTAYVILAAGRGTRVGRVGGDLHKALLPLGGRATLSHLIDAAPSNARIMVCVGDRARQLRDYVLLAHPTLPIRFITVDDWSGPGSGPGRSLLAARPYIGDDDMLFTSCDTLSATSIDHDPTASWAAYAPMPAGTEPHRWCRFDVHNDEVVCILDKTPLNPAVSNVYTGLAHIARDDLETFWNGVLTGRQVNDELQVTGGLHALVLAKRLSAQRIDWIDTGDETAYRRAVAQFSGYDWTKTDQATYVLPDTGRVVKYMSDRKAIIARWHRGRHLGPAVPRDVAQRTSMLAYEYVPGETVYERLEHDDDPLGVARRLLIWRSAYLTRRVTCSSTEVHDAVAKFYRDKTLRRIERLGERLHDEAIDAVRRVDFDVLEENFEAGIPHGDLNYGNVIVTPQREFVGIDWREDFAGAPWFDLRYDAAKLLAGTVVHWGRARRGDFTPWRQGADHAAVIRDYLGEQAHSTEVIAALSLLNSAPLHASPLDEILVARGCAWLERLT